MKLLFETAIAVRIAIVGVLVGVDDNTGLVTVACR